MMKARVQSTWIRTTYSFDAETLEGLAKDKVRGSMLKGVHAELRAEWLRDDETGTLELHIIHDAPKEPVVAPKSAQGSRT